MFGSEILEIAIGVVFIYLLASLVATAIREAIEGILKTRAIQLERGIRLLLDDPSGSMVTKQLFDHPLLYSLFAGQYNTDKLTGLITSWRPSLFKKQPTVVSSDEPRRMGFFTNLPSYIPSRNFALALMHLVAGTGADGGSGELSLGAIKTNVQLLPDSKLRQALLVALAESEGDFDRARASIEAWFDGTMDRVSGWYKRETSWILFGIGLATAISLNIDTVNMARYLAANNTQRQALVTHVSTVYPELKSNERPTDEQFSAEIRDLSSIIGYSALQSAIEKAQSKSRESLKAIALADPKIATDDAKIRSYIDANMSPDWQFWLPQLLAAVPGWVISALAISLGAPFWFDALNKLMVIRSTVKPYEKSPPEGSADRAPAPGFKDLLATPHPAMGAIGVLGSLGAPGAHPAVLAPVEANIRLAFDLGGADPTSLQVTHNGVPVTTSTDPLVEIPLQIGASHEISATASDAGRTVSWSQIFVPTADDEARPVGALLT